MLPKVSIKKFALYALGVCLLLTGVNRAQTDNLRPAGITTIKNGSTVSHIFTIEVKKQQIISLEVKQNGMDVKVELSNPQGITIASADYPLSAQEVERIFVVADEDGQYQLKIDSKFSDAGGSAAVKLNAVKNAAPVDFKHAEAEKLFSQAQSLRATGKTDDRRKAVEVYQKSLLVWQAIDDKIGELRTLAILAYLHRVLGDYKKSLEVAGQILQFPKIADYNPYRGYALYQIGQINFDNGDIKTAVSQYREAISLFSEPSPKQLNIEVSLGYTYQSIDEFELAQNAFDSALDNIRQFPDVYNEAQARHIIGLFNFNLNDYDAALANFQLAAEMREKSGNRRSQAISLTFLGMTYQAAKNFPKALEALEKALPISQALDDRENQLDTLIYLARVHRETGNPAKALELYKQASLLLTDVISPSSLYLSMGATYTQLSDFSKARDYFEKALIASRKIGDIGAEATILYQFALLERAENKLDAAENKLEHALQIHEYEQAKYKNIRRLSNFLETRRRYFDLYIDVLMRLDKERPNEHYAFKALQTSESARMRTLIWQYREAFKNSPQAIDFQLVSQIQKIQLQIGETAIFTC